ncbi:hypothetical protein LDENG_00167430 [Lucifuga dentata]|nr:hypothetical protein LDENG_00167430 [Lucifuga dentata]
MVIAVSRLAFWVESARVGVERVSQSQQRSSIPCGTPRMQLRASSVRTGVPIGLICTPSEKHGTESLPEYPPGDLLRREFRFGEDME